MNDQALQNHQASAKAALRRLADKAQSASEQRSLKAKAEDAARSLERERRLTEEKLNRRATL